MRIKAIMVGAIAGLALATLTANAGNYGNPPRDGKPGKPGSGDDDVHKGGRSRGSDSGHAQRRAREGGRAGG